MRRGCTGELIAAGSLKDPQASRHRLTAVWLEYESPEPPGSETINLPPTFTSLYFDYLYYAFGYQCLTTFAGALRKWRLERGWDPNDPSKRIVSVQACEHIVVFNKRDLVPSWGMEVTVYQTCFAVTAF